MGQYKSQTGAMTKEKYVSEFKKHLEQLGYSEGSVYMLPSCVKEFLECQGHSQIANISSSDIVHHHEYLQSRPNKRKPGGLSSIMINHHLYAIRLFLAWQEQLGVITENPMSSLEFPRPQSKPREVLTVVEIKQLYEVTETLQERAIIALFYGCGLRRTEGERLNIKDLHFRSNLLYVREGKGSKRRVVPLSDQVKADLKAYLHKERWSKPNEAAYMTNRVGTRMLGMSYSRILKSLLSKTTIEKDISLHSLRHSIATHLLESGMAVEYVRDFLGHQHLEATQIYTRISKKQLWNL